MSEQLNGAVKKIIDESELDDEVWRRFSESDAEFEIDWDEGTLAKLLDFDDDSNPGSTVVTAEVAQSLQTQTANANTNVITQSELFDDPHAGKTQPTLAGNPFAKFGTVGLGLGVVFVTAAFFLNTVMKGKPKAAPEMVKTTPKPEIVALEKKEDKAETGKLKAQLALGKQAEQIKAVEAAKSPKSTINESPKETLPKRTIPINKPSPTPHLQRPDPAVQFIPPRNPPSHDVSERSFPVRRLLPPVENVALKPVRSAFNNELPITSSKKSPNVQQADPFAKHMPERLLEQWVAMSRLGSYGSGKKQLQTSLATATRPQSEFPSASNVQSFPQELVVVAPKATPVVFASEGARDVVAPQSPSAPPLLPDPNLEKNILTGNPVQQLRVGMTAINDSESQILDERTTVQQLRVGMTAINDSESQILNERTTVQQLRVGMTARGKIATPMVWVNPSTTQTKSDGRSQGEENFVVRLTQPIVDDEGYEIFPAGSEIVCTVQGVHQSGYTTVQATRLVVDGREYVLPKGAIAITGKGGNPLIASRYGDKGAEIASRDATAFVFGSLAKVGKVLNEPDETSSFASVGIGGSTSTTSIKGNKSNLLGAVLEGGFTPLTQEILARNQAALAEITKREDVWFVRAGTDVQIVVNQSFEL
ncbi:TrbI/VirB10 family protein [Brasilonema sp. CT11]|nr:TrbI/VirB10 family protein [Brasilonema sp. CT11]